MANEYQSNSHKFKKEQAELASKQKEVKKVVTGPVRIKKKNRLMDAFISEDAKNVKSHAFMEVLVPAVKKAVVDVVTDGIHMIFYGEKGHRGSSVDKISYRQFSDPRSAPRLGTTRQSNSVYDYDKITLESRAEAEAVLAGLDDMIDSYGRATVADLYDLIGVSHNFTDNAYGWYNLSEARAVPALGGGYTLRLPKVTTIEK